MKKNTVTQKQIDDLLSRAKWDVAKSFGKCTTVSCQLPNGFVITESSACVDPANYDQTIGESICRKRIKEKVWELEGYLLQSKLDEENTTKPECVTPVRTRVATGPVRALAETVPGMLSEDYKDRFRAEVQQLEYRIRKLDELLLKYELGQLDFEQTFPEGLLQKQLACMKDYHNTLRRRAKIEEIEL